MVEEIDANQLDSLCQKQLLIQAKDLKTAQTIILQKGFNNIKIEGNTIKIEDTAAILNPEKIASIMVNAGCPPSLLHVQEEDLESYFLRTIKKDGGLK